MPEKPRRLGRGLEALIGASPAGTAAPAPAAPEQGAVQRIPIPQIRANPYQPRKQFRAEELADLENSLRTSGLLQPITVRSGPGSTYELVAGERRLRAATRLGWTEIPAILKEVDDRALLTLALVENLQRADLNPIEEAEGYSRLVAEFSLTQQSIAEAVGKDRSTVANSLRLLGLPEAVQRLLQEGQITVGHARALLALSSEREIVELARDIVVRQLSVRDVERRVKGASVQRQSRKSITTVGQSSRDAEVRRITDMLRRHFQTDVQLIVDPKDRGEIRITFYSSDDLERVLELIVGRHSEDM